MAPDIFIDDFENTENTEELHAILGRSLIVATRFDKLCDHTAKFIDIKKSFAFLSDAAEFDDYVNILFKKFSTLNDNIRSLPLGQPEKDILHNARIARNEIAHSLTIGLTGCLDAKIDEHNFKAQVSDLVSKVAKGDYLISALLSILNKNPLPTYTDSFYIQKILGWVQGQ